MFNIFVLLMLAVQPAGAFPVLQFAAPYTAQPVQVVQTVTPEIHVPQLPYVDYHLKVVNATNNIDLKVENDPVLYNLHVVPTTVDVNSPGLKVE